MNGTKTIDAGKFDRQLTIQNEVENPDGCGGFATSLQAVDTAWAHICPLGHIEAHRAGNEVLEISHRVYMRHRPDLKISSRLITGSRQFEVTSFRDLDETGRYLECDVIERK